MPHISIKEMERDFPACFERAEFGETVIITRDGRPVFELRPVRRETSGRPRPFGLCKGEFHVPDDFDAPLPEHLMGGGSWPDDILKTEKSTETTQ